MAIESITGKLVGKYSGEVYFTSDTIILNKSSENEYTVQITAPNMSSYNLDDMVFDLQLLAKTVGGKTATASKDSEGSVGAGCSLVVKEKIKPVAAITNPSSNNTYINNNSLGDFAVQFTATDKSLGEIKDSGIDIDSLSLMVTRDGQSVDIASSDVTSAYDSENMIYNFSYKPSSGFLDGNYSVSFSISDFDGNTSDAATRTFIIDTVAPSITINANSVSNVKTATINGTTDATGNITVILSITNGEYHQEYELNDTQINIDGSFTKEVILEEGTNLISAYATDVAGNTSDTTTISILVDTTVPKFEMVKMEPNPADNGQSLLITVRVNSVYE